MKSTIKVDFNSQHEGAQPVIKIIQPFEVSDQNSTEHDVSDIDVRDKLLKDFLHTPCMTDRNSFFRVSSCFSHPPVNPNINVITISPIQRAEMFDTFRYAILNRIVPIDTIEDLNSRKGKFESIPPYGFEDYVKIHEFFDWLLERDKEIWEIIWAKEAQ